MPLPKDPERAAEARARMSAAAKARFERPGERERNRDRMVEYWSDPDRREQQRVLVTRPETMSRLSESARAQWADPDTRAAMTEGIRDALARPETAQRLREAQAVVSQMPHVIKARSDAASRLWAEGRSRGGRRYKSGSAADLGDTFFRSSWERNVARLLNYFVAEGVILEWGYEVNRFEFPVPQHRNGKAAFARCFVVDFSIVTADGETVYWEVKGFLDAASKVKKSRMEKYFPDVPLVWIDSDEYYRIQSEWASQVPGWEWSGTPEEAVVAGTRVGLRL